MKINYLISKQVILFLIVALSVSTLFLPLSTLRAATLTNGMDAAYVIGAGSATQDFTANATGTDAGSFWLPFGVGLDETNNYLFTVDSFSPGAGGNNRISVWELNADHTLVDYTADYVLGQNDFTSIVATTTQNGVNRVQDVAIDEENERLFVVDEFNMRILVFDYSGGFSNGMNASYVIGQADFTSAVETTTQSGLNNPRGVDYDEENERLFVVDEDNRRVLVFDLSGGITNGMNASYVIGQGDFTSRVESVGTSTFGGHIESVYYSEVMELLFVSDDESRRVLAFDLSGGTTDGMAASYVFGQTNFASSADLGTTDSSFGGTGGVDIAMDESAQLLFLSDAFSNRVLAFDLSGGATNGMAASYVLGQEDFVSSESVIDQDGLLFPFSVEYSQENDLLYVGDTGARRYVVFDLSSAGDSSQQSSSSFTYVTPPLCSANFSPNTITEGESTTYSWNITWPTNNQNTYYVKVPGKDGGLFSSNVHSIQMTPEHTQTITTYTFNLWGATPCTETITVLDQEGNEILPTNKNNLTISAGASNHPFIRPFVLLFAKLFVR